MQAHLALHTDLHFDLGLKPLLLHASFGLGQARVILYDCDGSEPLVTGPPRRDKDHSPQAPPG